ncbi:PspC domain-containing protein [Flavobacterium capsici]|uniref:PspC domain-containing protein n=1 Tax=Flavobacterium capsici TaxID=3075618 RepID=A0AA96F350_9FLAO|nr:MULTISPECIES: PspC domain-containing protein [unclassified Flavobacterium]WNM17789.1 PspC domain-containing protein [Flavobacterium sp. PMR2A8]WNM21842.1 PspC domain-containing protein [Flavobacterium sp. PMTSA4]
MNKTVNINIGGLIFHIDEDAFQKLTRYFEAIKRSLSNSSGQDEIMKDIEMRVAELLTEKQKSDKHVINNKDVEEVITIMGQPEDYRIDDDSEAPKTETYYSNSKRRKLYRDKDRGTIAGVCTGLGHYFGVEALWFKILFLIFVFAGFGTGIIAYFVLWIAVPKAITTSEKLEMTGQPVTISSIEKKVREEFESVSEKFKNADYDKMGNQVKHGADRVASGLGDFIMKVFGVFAKVLGAFILIFSSLSLVGLFVGLFTFGSTSFIDTPWQRYINAVNYTDVPLWVFGLLSFLAIGIPLFFFLLLGLKLMVTNMKSIGNPIKYSLLAIWIISVSALVVIGIKQSTERAFEGKSVTKENIIIQPNDTLNIKFVSNDFFSKDVFHREDFEFTQDSLKNEVIYSNEVKFHIKKTDKPQAYLQIERLAEGKSFREANERAEKIKYSFKVSGNQLLLDNYLLTEMASKYRNQNVELYLYLPVGTIFKADDTVQEFDYSDNSFFNLHYSSDNYTYKVESNQIKCLDCPADENEYDDVDAQEINISNDNDSTETVTVKINGKVVTETKKGKKGKLQVNSEGVIIKTE